MSGAFGENSLNFFSGTKDFYSHKIGQSLRFEDGDSPSLSRTPSSTGNQRTWTWSGWIKRGNIDTTNSQYIFSAYGSGTNYTALSIGYSSDDDIFRFEAYDGGANLDSDFRSVRVLRDVSSWYHIVLAVDTTQSTSSNRVKIYINGDLQTSYTTQTFMAQNFDTAANSGVSHQVGSINSGYHFDGYMAEVNFIDGQALDPTSFGETKAGIWIPKDTSGLTFGTNGFRLKFQDSSALGDDTSGNGNDLSSSGLASTDVVLDSPTNNFATMNPLVRATDFTFAEGNLKATVGSTAWDTAASTYFLNSGKWYAEFHILDTNRVAVGAVSNLYNPTTFIGNNAEGIGYYDQGYTYASGANVTTGLTTFTNGDLIQVALNLDDSEISFYKANTLIRTENLPSSTGQDFSIAVSGYGSGSGAIVNFGQDSSFAGTETAQGNTDGNGKGDFYYSPPSGYLAFCTANLPNPAIDNAQDEEPADYFDTALWTGNGSTQSISSLSFQPDWVWIKERSGGASHAIFDSVRGATKRLKSDSTDAELTQSTGLTSFDSDGFSLGSNTAVNASSDTFVAWNWLAGGTAVSNTEGSITSSVSANTEAGFSIVSYTGTASADTVGHGLSQAPELVIWKDRETAVNWLVQGDVMGAAASGYLMLLNSTGSSYANSNFNTTLGASTITLDAGGTNYNGNGKDTIAYCFHSVDGYSKIGSYSGNGSTDGAFVYTGFRPAWVIIKRTDSTGGWSILDDVRTSNTNPVDRRVQANDSDAEESAGVDIDFNSNGFKLRNSASSMNNSSGSYLYLAFGDQPFKYANAR